MTDGHTEEGSYEVLLKLNGDQAQQLTRLLDMAKMIDGRSLEKQIDGQISDERRPETMDIIGYRAFLEEMLVLIRDAIADQNPANQDGGKGQEPA